MAGKKPLTPAQQAQQNNRTQEGRYKDKTRDVPESVSLTPPLVQMRPAERYTRVKAMIAALSDYAKEMEAELLTTADQVGVKSFDTPLGPVSVTTKTDTPVVADPEALARLLPEDQRMVVPKPYALAAVQKRLTIVGNQVVDTSTGEIVDWADIKPGGDPYISWPSSTKQREAKQEVAEALRGQIDTVLTLSTGNELTA